MRSRHLTTPQSRQINELTRGICRGLGTRRSDLGIIKNGGWHEVGDRIVAGRAPVRLFEMDLKRVGDTSRPAAAAINPK